MLARNLGNFESNLCQALAKNCVKPAYEYFQEKFHYYNGELKNILSAFKAAWLFSSSQIDEKKNQHQLTSTH